MISKYSLLTFEETTYQPGFNQADSCKTLSKHEHFYYALTLNCNVLKVVT